ncbi:MAG TPA: glycoside hydrolase family 36 protein [Microlunatus sp.]|nr:glycoside hydrolase family 36 protein [Microlunatus sp.]
MITSAAAGGFQVVRAGPGTEILEQAANDGIAQHSIDVVAGAELDLRLEVPLGAAVGYWHPAVGAGRTLPADWAARTSTSLVSGAPVGCLHDAAGSSLFAWGLDELVDELEISYGVSEENKTFALEFRARSVEHPRSLSLATVSESSSLPSAVRRLARWSADRLDSPALPVPAVARRPVYSTWYTFTQDLDQPAVESEAALAARLGCGSVFVDDGWQRLAVGRGYGGCGDWVPDTAKFPDLARFSATLHDQDLGVVLWIAPLLLGPDADFFAELADFAPHEVTHLRCRVLDPRHREVRTHLAATCRRLVIDYDLDGLKIDFLDQAMAYRGTPSAGDIDDVGEAMRALLALIRSELSDAGRGATAVEFRQPYVSPAIAAYGQILRAGDCPADAVVNRRSTIDARLLAVGQIVHGDMLMWGPTGGAEAVAQQLYGSWFAVPQISMRLDQLSELQSSALSGLLSLWADSASVVLDGSLTVRGSERSYDLVRAERADLARTVISRYAPVPVDVDEAGEVLILNATADQRVLVRLGAELAITGGSVRDPSVAVVAEVAAGTAGLAELIVPAYGSLSLEVVRDPT